uniref:RIN4 pathogenic type III effector avirulence factor Avr cleavage site domain-containing protein n=1 Tax=Oryza punctata TaxID=4537 RepID=A0A0E0LVR0_ORYPU
MEMEVMSGWQIPAFGAWNYRDDLPITQCFDLAMQARLMRRANRRVDGNCERRLVVPFDAWPPPAPRGPAHSKVIRREVAQKQAIMLPRR